MPYMTDTISDQINTFEVNQKKRDEENEIKKQDDIKRKDELRKFFIEYGDCLENIKNSKTKKNLQTLINHIHKLNNLDLENVPKDITNYLKNIKLGSLSFTSIYYSWETDKNHLDFSITCTFDEYVSKLNNIANYLSP